MAVVTTVHSAGRFAVTTGNTTSATAKTRTTIAHGLGDIMGIDRKPRAVIAVPVETDDDTTASPSGVGVVSWDETNAVVKSDGSSVPFTLIAFY